MQSFRISRVRGRTPSRMVPGRHQSREELGCVAVRRITDDAGRVWRVREFRSHSGFGLFFRCEIPGIRSEARAAAAPLQSMDEDRLVYLLQSGAE